MRIVRRFVALALVVVAAGSAAAQSLDPTFAPPAVFTPGAVFSTTEQADGKILVTGEFTRLDGAATPARLLRFLPTGPLDAAFQQNLGTTSRIFRTRTLSNGKLLLVAYPNAPLTAAGLTRNGLLRLNTDGTADATLNPGSGPDGYFDDALELPTGQLIVLGRFDQINGSAVHGIARLNADGTRDMSFGQGAGANNEVVTAVRLASGKLLIGGFFTSYDGVACNGLARLNADGSYDPTFTTTLQSNSQITNIIEQPDGNMLIAGYPQYPRTTAAGGKGVVRLLPDGSIDPSFVVPSSIGSGGVASFYGDIMQRQPDGKLLVGYGGTSFGGLFRLNTDGSLDASYQPGSGPNSKPYSLTLLSSGKLLVSGAFTSFDGTLDRTLVQLGPTGALDAAWQPKLQAPGWVNSMVRQASGQTVVGGTFSEINGQPARRLARFNADGTLDAAFSANTAGGLPFTTFNVVQQPDGRLLTHTAFGLYRFQADGTPDNSLSTAGLGLANPTSILAQPDGRILLAGQFTGNPATNTIIRLEANGARDNSFALTLPTGHSMVPTNTRLALQPDGKLLIGCTIPVSAAGSQAVLRVSATGAHDASFATTPLNATLINTIVVQPDAKVLIGGNFTTAGGTSRSGLVRLNADGTLDAGFVPAALSGTVNALAVQPNGRVLVGGSFTSTAGLPANLARLNADGSADASFAATAVPSATVRSIMVQPDGKLLIGGNFTTLSGQNSNALARLTAPNVLRAILPQAVADRTTAWPVPARTTLHVALDPAARAQTLELLDVLGRPVRQQALRGAAEATVAVDDLPVGQYLLRVNYPGGSVTRRVSVQ